MLFAAPSLVRGEVPLRIPRKKSLALLAVLAAQPTPETRASLGAMLWPALGQTRARAALRSALWDLQQTLGADAVATSRADIRCTDAADIDVVELRRALAAAADVERAGNMDAAVAPLERAVALYRGDFLQGFALAGHAAFTEWQAAQTETFRAARWRALTRLVDLCAARGDVERALFHAERMLAIAPLDPAAHRRVIRLLLDAGDRAAALERYTRLVRILAEHHREPDPETRALFEAARGNAPPSGEPASPPAPPPAPQTPALPATFTPLVGREQDLTRVLARLRDPHGRVVTITGIGGVGKTRLALEAAARFAPEMEHGVRFVSLAPVAAPEHVALAVAAAVAPSRPASAADPAELLAGQRTLLVLDGFEHLLGAAAWLADLLARAPGVRVLATSRERLHLRGEWEVPLAGLPHAAAAGPALAPAIELFLRSATRTDPSFAIAPADEPAVARVCELLEGIPLGIELAATWVRHHGVAEIARRMESDLDFLTAPRDAPESHRSLRGTFARSWELLSDEERAALRGLSALRAPFDEATAHAVAHASAPVLASLGARSLLSRVSGDRHSLHQIIRRYAAEELARTPDDERAVHARHRTFFLDLCAQLSADLPGAAAATLLRRIDAAGADVRAAFTSAIELRAWDDLDRALFGFFTALDVQGRDRLAESLMDETARALRAELEKATRGRRELRKLLGRVLARQARAGLEYLPGAAVADTLAESIRLLRKASATADLCYALNTEGRLAARAGDLAAARSRFREALRLRKETGDRRGVAIGYNNLSVIACTDGDYPRAERLLRRSLRIFRAQDDRRSTVACLSSLGDLRLVQGDLDGAESALREGLAMGREAGDRFSLAMLHAFLGSTLLAAARVAEAGAAFDEALAIARSADQEETVATALLGLGTTARLRGDLDRAERSLTESLALWRKLGGKPKIAEAQAALGLVLAARRRPHEARAELLGALARASELGAAPLVLDVLVSTAEARAFGPAHARDTAAIVAAHPGAGRSAARRAARILAAAPPPSPAPPNPETALADLVKAMLSTRA